MSSLSRFLARWSRMKRATRPGPGAPLASLPPLAALDADADLSAYLHHEVDEKLRRQALRLIFSDPRLNVMDGLDTYIDDYTIADPIPDTMLAQMNQMRRVLDGDDADAVGDAPVPEFDHATEPPPHERADGPPCHALTGSEGETQTS